MINSTNTYHFQNNYGQYPQDVNFNSAEQMAILTKPIEGVQKTIEGSVDTFVKTVEKEKKKKSNKTAVAAGSATLIVTGLVALLNPKFSTRTLTKLKNWAHNAGIRGEKNKDNQFKNKFYRGCQNTYNKTMKFFSFVNTGNAMKDVGFKYLCTQKKSFSKVKNDKFRSFLQKIDSGFVKIMSKINNGITNWFDRISKKTVLTSYKKANKSMDHFDLLIKQYRDKMPHEKQVEIDKKLAEIQKARKHFNNSQVESRFVKQENLMSNLEPDFKNKTKDFIATMRDKKISNKQKKEHINQNMSYWAEDMLQDTKENLIKSSDDKVENLMQKYDDLLSSMNYLSSLEKQSLRSRILNINKKLSKANINENDKYFDKKRDLMLGGGPTDIVSSLGSLGLCGLAVASADTKEDRVSRLLTTGFPLVAGVGASLAFTAMLFSGVQGLLLGGATSLVLSKTGNIINKQVRGKDIDKDEANVTKMIDSNPFKPKEEVHA